MIVNYTGIVYRIEAAARSMDWPRGAFVWPVSKYQEIVTATAART